MMRLLSSFLKACFALITLFFLGAIFYGSISRFDINSDFYVEKHYFSDSYDLRSHVNDEFIVPDVEGWILSHDYVYGGYGGSGFFAFKVGQKSFHKFNSVSALNEFLSAEGIDGYDVGAEENVSHLKYGGIRNRKY